MKKVIKIDASGLFVEDVLIADDAETPSDCIDSVCPDGFYRPKWNGSQWVEGLTQAEIDAIIANAVTTEKSLEELAEEVQIAMMAIMYLSIE
jgi:hypothetical protein